MTMALALKPACEKCAAPLSADSSDARICSYECTFCAKCAEAMNATCPNCGGELVARPRRKSDHGISEGTSEGMRNAE
jgi:hypothetical protein